ncbi:hypothetical protein BDM02DRAFT_3109888 [Thelephora ganbajun]|uniref:Uncharacterized protein n=1 Tax=Thelephora ganbajun TaxID=370292 RepID=A0ACB6ZQV8_THEGA|nr:hypothetical protein BDM02DRAFT_3109888 [Thelephora ganbajun]
MSSVYFSSNHRSTNSREKARLTNGLPSYSAAIQEKLYRHGRSSSWLVPLSTPIPGIRGRRLRLWVPNPARIHQVSVARFGRKRGTLVLCFGVFLLVFATFAVHRRFNSSSRQWPTFPTGDPPTLVFARADLQQMWKWEIDSGHYPSSQKIPEAIGFSSTILNPALPPRKAARLPPRLRPVSKSVTSTNGVGLRRVYLDIRSPESEKSHPPRLVTGSIADLDIVMKHCDFSTNQYVRDCLEVLRLGAGLDNGPRLRRGDMSDWKYIYVEDGKENFTDTSPVKLYPSFQTELDADPNVGLSKKRGVEWEKNFTLPAVTPYKSFKDLPDGPCDEDHPRLFHMFWTGPFTDKPYLAMLSFLYTQNLGLHLSPDQPDPKVCRPQFWLWINPGPAASVPNPNALRNMFESLKTNPWASPFLHPRFKDVIQFKLWNTTEQLDGIPELKDEWRTLEGELFNSGGHIIQVPKEKENEKPKSSVTISSTSKGTDGSKTVAEGTSATNEADNVLLNSRSFFMMAQIFEPIHLSLKFPGLKVSELLLRLPDALFDAAWLNTEFYQRDRPPQPYFQEFGDFFNTPAQNSAAPQAIGLDGFFKGSFSYHFHNFWWQPFDSVRNWPDLGPRFTKGELIARTTAGAVDEDGEWSDKVEDDKRDLDWSMVLKRTFEAFIRGETPNLYGEHIAW